MSVESTNLVLGSGRIFAKRSSDADGKWRMIGELSGEVVFTYTPETAEQKVANSLGPVGRRKVSEQAMIKASIADFKMTELKTMLGITKTTTAITGTQSLRVSEEMTFVSSTISLSKTAKSKTSVAATSLDRGTEYVSGTDFTVISVNSINPLLAGFAGTKMIHYTTLLKTAQRWNVGGDVNLAELSLMFVHPQPNKKVIGIVFHKATIDGDVAIPFNEKEFTTREITFKALEDTTKAKGNRLFDIVREP